MAVEDEIMPSWSLAYEMLTQATESQNAKLVQLWGERALSLGANRLKVYNLLLYFYSFSNLPEGREIGKFFFFLSSLVNFYFLFFIFYFIFYFNCCFCFSFFFFFFLSFLFSGKSANEPTSSPKSIKNNPPQVFLCRPTLRCPNVLEKAEKS